jgi:HlyD family secretion protein
MIVTAIAVMPFISIDISIKTFGILRPLNERTEVKSLLNGIIDTIFYREGMRVTANSVLLKLADKTLLPKKLLNSYELQQRKQFIHDLKLLTTNHYSSDSISANLLTPVFKQQVGRFHFQIAQHLSALKKIKREIEINNILISDRIITPKDHFDKKIEAEQLAAAISILKSEQITFWHEQLSRYELEFSKLETESKQLEEEEKRCYLFAPISGTLLGVNNKYPGSLLQAGETFCIISPDSGLIAECYVPAKNIGLLKVNQPAKFQVEAFDYKYFGDVTGSISSIDNDFTLLENQPHFKIRCRLDRQELKLKNGFNAALKKGLTIQCRFIICRRTVWQLLFDTINNWVNPRSPT